MNVLALGQAHGSTATRAALLAAGCEVDTQTPTDAQIATAARLLEGVAAPPLEPHPGWEIPLSIQIEPDIEVRGELCRRVFNRPGPSTQAGDDRLVEALLAEERDEILGIAARIRARGLARK